MFFWLPCFRPKSFGFFGIWLLVCFRVTLSQLLIEFSFVDLEGSILSLLFNPFSISLQPSFFHQHFLVYFLKFAVIFSCAACSFLFSLISAPFFFIILACFRIFFLFAFPVEFPISILTFSACFLRGSQFSHKLILHLHRLVHLTRLYYSSVCKEVWDLFYSFLSWVFSILCFLIMVELSFHYSWFSLHFLDLSFVLVIVFIPGCLVVYRLEVWCFHFPKFFFVGLFLFDTTWCV